MRDESANSFHVFAFSWALVILFGMSSERMAATVMGVVVTLTATWTLLRPHPTALASLCAAYIVHFWMDDYRAEYVHVFLDFICCSAILIGLAASRPGARARWTQRFMANSGPPLLALTALGFFAAGLAKLNWDFLDPRTSCASAFLSYQVTVPPYSWLMPETDLMRYLAIYGTVVLEILAPLLWLHPRTRKVGIVLGWAMMFLLATNPKARYYVFVGPFAALLLVGFDTGSTARWIRALPSWVHTAVRTFIVLAVGIAMTRGEVSTNMVHRHFFVRIIAVGWMLWLVVATLGSPVAPRATTRSPLWMKSAWVVTAFLLCFELLPYMGLRTPRNLSMAANFSVNEGYSNHVVFQRPIPIPGGQLPGGNTWNWVPGRRRRAR